MAKFKDKSKTDKFKKRFVVVFFLAAIMTFSAPAYAGGNVFKDLVDGIVDLAKSIASSVISAAETLTDTNPTPTVDTSPTKVNANFTQLLIITNEVDSGQYSEKSAGTLFTIGDKSGLINFYTKSNGL